MCIRDSITENKTLNKEERKIWCVVEVPAENTKTGRWHELSAPITAHLERLKKITRPKNKNDLLFLNQSTGKPLSSRIWRDSLLEMLVEAGLATWSEDDSNNQRKAEIKSGKILTWYSFRHTWITFALERGVPIATVCNNCDTSIEYIQEHYFHYDAKRATGALATGRKGLRTGSGSGLRGAVVKERFYAWSAWDSERDTPMLNFFNILNQEHGDS